MHREEYLSDIDCAEAMRPEHAAEAHARHEKDARTPITAPGRRFMHALHASRMEGTAGNAQNGQFGVRRDGCVCLPVG